MNQKPEIGLHKYDLDTPCLVIDVDALQDNLNVMQQHGLHHHVNIRPHAKTHKCSQLAKLQMQFGAIGICATKISEAEVLVSHGIMDVLITSPIITKQKLKKLAHLLLAAPQLLVVTDNINNVFDLNQIGESIRQSVRVLVDIDPGIGRTGVNPAQALELAMAIEQCPWLTLQGIQCYAGNLQHILSYEERRKKSIAVMRMAAQVLNLFREHHLQCSILTGSGTGTYDIDVAVPEVTEIQPGSYAVMDVEYYAIGSKHNATAFPVFKHAMTLLTSVIGSNRQEHVTVDAGTKSVYVDSSHKPQIINFKNLQYDWGGFGDEHGKVTAIDHANLPRQGEVLELIVPHCDPTINLFDKFYITKQDVVIDVWNIDMRGKAQ